MFKIGEFGHIFFYFLRPRRTTSDGRDVYYSAHGKSNFTGKNAPVNGEIFGRETGPESGHVPKNSLFWKIELKLNECDCRRDATNSRFAFVN